MASESERSFIEALRATRADYAHELAWHKFLLDAFAGTGGFEGKVRQPFASFWGAAAEMYARSSSIIESDDADERTLDTYLDRFPREDIPKFRRRVANSQYPNYVEPIVDIRLSYMHRKGLTRSEVPELLEQWQRDATGADVSWDRLVRETISPRAALLGWCPVLFDKPPAPLNADGSPREMTRAEARARRIVTTAIPLFPANLLDWQTDDAGRWEWVKIMTTRMQREHPLAPSVTHDIIDIWFSDRVERYTIERDKDGKEHVVSQANVPHAFGVVPLTVLRHKPLAQCRVRGLPMAGSVSRLARKLFNYLSELDEHIRASVFSFLQVPAKSQEQAASLVLGNANSLPIPPDSSRDYKWIQPDGTVAVTLEKRAEVTTREIYRVGRTEYTRASAGGSAESGTARAFAFEQTNRAIADFAANVARFEEEANRLVGRMEGVSEAELEKMRIIAPDKFDVEEMARDLDDALKAIEVDLGQTALSELRKRLARRMLPNLDDETLGKIDDELDQAAEEAAQAAAAMRDAAVAAAQGVGGDEEDDEEDGNGPQRTKGAPFGARA